ncbi:general amidase [Gautieria morchelliformis]|nr:general amidase [Gautieria morchelliformis]
MTDTWKAIALDKKTRQQASIPQEWLVPPPSEDRLNVIAFPRESGLLSPTELTITESTVETLLANLASSTWTSVDVTRAFYKRAILAHQAVNCLTEIFVDQALSRAAELDAHLKRTGTVVGPLHGLPISLKDQLCMKGLETTMGYVSWVGKYAERDATLVEILYEQGAVPFVRTNVPQTLMWPETFNNVFGRTVNPFNRSLTCGGSSGGEGALVGLHGSPIGVGSDIGGSIRFPASFNGLYGLRPSYHRIPYRGALNSLEGQDSLPSVLGPLSHSMSGIKAFMKAVIDAKPWRKDPLAVHKPWDQQEYELVNHGGGRELVFAILWNDENVTPNPPIIRALEVTRKALIAAGHKVIDWKPYKHAQLIAAARAIWRSGSAEDYKAATAPTGEPLIKTMDLDQDASPSSKTRMFLPPPATPTSAYDLWQAQKLRLALRQEHLDYWAATAKDTGTGRPVDAIIGPIAAYPAPPHGKNSSADYTTVWNSLDYPALSFPVTAVDPTLDPPKPAHNFMSEEDKQIYELYTPETFKDAPVGLQLVGRTQEEEALIRMGEILERAFSQQAKL